VASVLPLVVVLLSAHPAAVDEPGLAEAVSVYIRDLGYEVRVEGQAPSAISPEELGRVAEQVRTQRVKLAFWCRSRQTARGGTEVVLFTVVDEGEVRAMPVAGVSGGALARVLALKVRAVLTGNADREPTEPVPAPAPPRPPLPVAAPAPPRPEPPAAANTPAPNGGTTAIRTADATGPAGQRRGLRGWFSAGYRLVVPADGQLIRHRALVEVALAVRWIELSLGFEVGNEPAQRFANGIASLGDYPFRVGVRGRVGRRRWSFAGGPVVSLHILDGDALGSDGSQGDRVVIAAGLGGEMGGEVRFTDHVAMQLRALVEYVLPEQRFLLHGERAFIEGGVRFGLALVVAVAAP
jgi:hypothetical protein